MILIFSESRTGLTLVLYIEVHPKGDDGKLDVCLSCYYF